MIPIVGFNSAKVQEGGGVNWSFKSFSQNQYFSQSTKNKSIYLKLNKFILALFVFEKRLDSQVNYKIMQIDFPDTHTDIMKKNSESQNRKLQF